MSVIVSIFISIVIAFAFFTLQWHFFVEVRKKRHKFANLFVEGENGYLVNTMTSPEGESYMQIGGSFDSDGDLGKLVNEINEYIRKSKGTTEFSVIQNKTERLEEMLYDDSTARMSFPIYLGLMGTFVGVFLGIATFLISISIDSINDDAIKGLLSGVLVSMSTSFLGLLLTTRNNYLASDVKRVVDIDKNKFFDFIQTELMPSLDVSMVSALNKLHDTVTQFEPSFNRVIASFQTTFDSCTRSFGEQFANNVQVVSRAVSVMGQNMDKINENIRLQTQLLNTIKSNQIARGLNAFVEATDHFTQLTESLNKFEQARRMMLRAVDETINMQKEYTESLQTPKELVIKVNNLLDRISTFEDSINALGTDIAQTQMVGNDTINLISEQLNGIKKKGKIADRYLGLADGRLEDLYTRQTAAINKMTRNYEQAIREHINGFDRIIADSTEDFQRRHDEFIAALNEKFNVAEVHEDFSNLRKLDDIDSQLSHISNLETTFSKFQQSLNDMKSLLEDIKKKINPSNSKSGRNYVATQDNKNDDKGGGFFGGIFGGHNRNK